MLPQQRAVPRARDRPDGARAQGAERLPRAARRRAALRARAAPRLHALPPARARAQPRARAGLLRAGMRTTLALHSHYTHYMFTTLTIHYTTLTLYIHC